MTVPGYRYRLTRQIAELPRKSGSSSRPGIIYLQNITIRRGHEDHKD
jgi:hypothetical protein